MAYGGSEKFQGRTIYASNYKSGKEFKGQNVLVVGCGNSGMQMSLDLSMNNATAFIVVRQNVSMTIIYCFSALFMCDVFRK